MYPNVDYIIYHIIESDNMVNDYKKYIHTLSYR